MCRSFLSLSCLVFVYTCRQRQTCMLSRQEGSNDTCQVPRERKKKIESDTRTLLTNNSNKPTIRFRPILFNQLVQVLFPVRTRNPICPPPNQTKGYTSSPSPQISTQRGEAYPAIWPFVIRGGDECESAGMLFFCWRPLIFFLRSIFMLITYAPFPPQSECESGTAEAEISLCVLYDRGALPRKMVQVRCAKSNRNMDRDQS